MMHEKMAPPFEKGHVPHNKGKQMVPPAQVPPSPPVQNLQPPTMPVAQNDPVQTHEWVSNNNAPAATVNSNNKRFMLPSTKRQPK